jgi:ankyrin repeat protein
VPCNAVTELDTVAVDSVAAIMLTPTFQYFPCFVYIQRKLNARKAAQRRNLEVLEKVAELNPSAFLVPDDLGWTPFHEAIRSGDLDCVEVILYAGNEMGDVDRTPVLLNLRTFAGLTPLDLARTYLSEDHPVTQLLIGLGGIDKNAQSQDEL